MSMTFVPHNRGRWTRQCALMYGYADPYKPGAREPDAMILRLDGVYHCAIGPDWNAQFVAETSSADIAMAECNAALVARDHGIVK